MDDTYEETGKNSAFFSHLKENETYKMSEWLKKRPFLCLSPTKKAAILAYLCHELLQNKAVIRQIDSAIETVAQLKRERWPLEANLRKSVIPSLEPMSAVEFSYNMKQATYVLL